MYYNSKQSQSEESSDDTGKERQPYSDIEFDEEGLFKINKFDSIIFVVLDDEEEWNMNEDEGEGENDNEYDEGDGDGDEVSGEDEMVIEQPFGYGDEPKGALLDLSTPDEAPSKNKNIKAHTHTCIFV